MNFADDLAHFLLLHHGHGRLTPTVGAETPNGYRLAIACLCGVTFERWVTPQDARGSAASALAGGTDLSNLGGSDWPCHFRRARSTAVSRPGRPSAGSDTMVDDPKAIVMVELEPEAVLLLTDQYFQDGVKAWSPKCNALSPLRLAQTTSPHWSSDKGQIYRIHLRREQAQELLARCVDIAAILQTFPGEEHRGYGQVLGRAGRALAEGLRLSEPE